MSSPQNCKRHLTNRPQKPQKVKSIQLSHKQKSVKKRKTHQLQHKKLYKATDQKVGSSNLLTHGEPLESLTPAVFCISLLLQHNSDQLRSVKLLKYIWALPKPGKGQLSPAPRIPSGGVRHGGRRSKASLPNSLTSTHCQGSFRYPSPYG